jgi:Na+-driven multidrug efflux pump
MAAPADANKKKKEDHNENLFEIMDGIILQLNKTKKMFILMIITILILPPISFVITFAIFGPPMFFDDGSGMRHEGFRFGAGGFGYGFALARTIPILIFIIWLGIGIRQWFVLSKWTKRYERYKQLQKKIDEKLYYDGDNADATQ